MQADRGRFVEHKDLWVIQNRARQQHALKLTTRQRGKAAFSKASTPPGCRAHCHTDTNRKVQEPPHSHRQRRIWRILGHIADAQIWRVRALSVRVRQSAPVRSVDLPDPFDRQ
jgi:hypothetical protein